MALSLQAVPTFLPATARRTERAAHLGQGHEHAEEACTPGAVQLIERDLIRERTQAGLAAGGPVS